MQLLLFLATFVSAAGKPSNHNSQPYDGAIRTTENQFQYSNASETVIDLGYAVYQGSLNATTNIRSFKGLRYAQPPVGPLRWQAPQPPTMNRTRTLSALEFSPRCPQSSRRMAQFQTTNETGVSEDCLFLSVFAPSNATNGPLPVFVWIHGGGYGESTSNLDMSYLINSNQNAFIGITLRYRLGAFGFLSSDEVYRKGSVNAGLLDQQMALKWVQQHIHHFNGDPDRVTIAGLSAGGGSVMLHGMAYGGNMGNQLFVNSFASSPYLPPQYRYNDWPVGTAASIFDCLVGQSMESLINASATVSQSGVPGEWSFAPVTDGDFIQDTPAHHLGRKRVGRPHSAVQTNSLIQCVKLNGKNMLVGSNAEDGHDYTPQNIRTEADLMDYLRTSFPSFSENDLAKILYYYPATNASVDPDAPLFATSGDSGPTAVNQSALSTGQQQRANNIHGEMIFICPSYWLAEAYSQNGGKAFKYQFSVPPAVHAADASAYFDPLDAPPYIPSLRLASQKALGNFIVDSDPSISKEDYAGGNSSAAVSNPAESWPPYSIAEPYQLDINTTCGTERVANPYFPGLQVCSGPGTQNNFRLVDAYTWEGGRGIRCDFWRSMADLIPQ